MALEGDTTALRLCIERIAPARKDAPIPDCLAVAKTDDRVENEQASEESAWTHVRFDRDALVEIWGYNVEIRPSEQDPATGSSTHKRKPEDLPVRRPKLKAARDYSAELEKCWDLGEAPWADGVRRWDRPEAGGVKKEE